MRRLHSLLLLVLATFALGGCDLVGDVLEFGFWTFVILIGIIILLVWGLRAALTGRRRPPPPPAP